MAERNFAEKHSIFKDIVLGGVLEGNGMPGFADELDETRVSGIQAYIVQLAREARAGQTALR